jgi:glycosyltransferase involved in cell wall biosynthesis
MKILFIQKEGGIFGVEQFQLRTIPPLIKKGVQIEFLRLYTVHQLGKDSPFVEKLESLGIKTYQLKITSIPRPAQFFKMKNIIKQGDFDIVHTHLIHADFYGAVVKKFLFPKMKLVSTKHGYDNSFTAKYGFNASMQKPTPYFLICRWVENQVDASFTISDGLLDFFTKIGMVKPNKMNRIHYGFDFDEVEIKPKDIEKYKLFERQIFIAGRLIGFKGHKYLIEAIDLIKDKFKDLGLVIAGTGELENVLKDKVKTLGLSDNVKFLGYSNEISKWMACSELIAVTSISEGFGVVFLEAFNAKTPVISFDVPSGNELMTHKKTGYLVKPYDVKALASTIEYVLVNKAQADSVAKESFSMLKNYFNTDRMSNEIIQFYKTII